MKVTSSKFAVPGTKEIVESYVSYPSSGTVSKVHRLPGKKLRSLWYTTFDYEDQSLPKLPYISQLEAEEIGLFLRHWQKEKTSSNLTRVSRNDSYSFSEKSLERSSLPFGRSPPYTLVKIGEQHYLVNPFKPTRWDGQRLGGGFSRIRYCHPIWLDSKGHLIIGPAEILKKKKSIEDENKEKTNKTYAAQGAGTQRLLNDSGNPNIASFTKFKNDDRQDTVLSVEPIVPGENVKTILKNPATTTDDRLHISLGILEDITARFFNKDLAHLDIKPENIVYDHVKKSAQLVDLDFVSSAREDKDIGIGGSAGYQAPEMFTNGGIRLSAATRASSNFKGSSFFDLDLTKIDIFALGITLADVLILKDKDKDGSFKNYKIGTKNAAAEKDHKVRHNKNLLIMEKCRPKFTELTYHGGSELGKFIDKMTQNNPEIRMDGEELKSVKGCLTDVIGERAKAYENMVRQIEKCILKTWPSGQYPAGVAKIWKLIPHESKESQPEGSTESSPNFTEIGRQIYQELKRGKEDSASAVSNLLHWRHDTTQDFYSVWFEVFNDFLFSKGLSLADQETIRAEFPAGKGINLVEDYGVGYALHKARRSIDALRSSGCSLFSSSQVDEAFLNWKGNLEAALTAGFYSAKDSDSIQADSSVGSSSYAKASS